MDPSRKGRSRWHGRQRRSSTGSLNGHARTTSEGTARPKRRQDVSRNSSTQSSALSLDVRCACQYFQSDMLLPERKYPIRSPHLAGVSTTNRDHEYEPVNPPDEGKQQHQPAPEVHIIAPSVDREIPPKLSVKIETSIRIPFQEEVIVQSDTDEALTAEEIQARIEDRFFNPPAPDLPTNEAPTPPPMTTTTATTENQEISPAPEKQGNKFQDALKNQAEKIRSKFRNIKKPDMSKFKVEKPKLSLPKLPDQVKVSLPSFTLPKRDSAAKKRSLKERQLSTESNVGDAKKKLFDFSTYPRIFSKKKKAAQQREEDFDETPVESATVPRTKELIMGSRWGKKLSDKKKAEGAEVKKGKAPDVIRIPLHSKESMDRERSDDEEDASQTRYDQDIEMEDADRSSPFSSDFSRNRWNRGSFHGENLHEIDQEGGEVEGYETEKRGAEEYEENGKEEAETYKITDLDSPPRTPSQALHSNSSSGDVHRRGVLEEINSDEFFLRQKGISQDDMGQCLSWEIREAFRQPVNPLTQMQDDDDLDGSDQSLQEQFKRKPIKKPKRKKTPHVSQEQMQESEPEEYQKSFEQQPPRPKRKSKTLKEPVIPYQDTEYRSVSDNVLNERCEDDRLFFHGGFKQEYPHQVYENQRMAGIEQPNILVSDPYERRTYKYADEEDEDDEELDLINNDNPAAPPRKNRSLKSLNTSEHDSITDEIKYANQAITNQHVEAYRMGHGYIIPTGEEPPVKPARNRSRTRSQSRNTQGEDEQQPCVEEPCVQQLCDYMGYAIIDKSKQKEPPLPPPVRRKRSKDSGKSETTKFFTVPRQLKDEAPIRPLRNYSTLVPKDSRRSATNITDEEKENFGNLNHYAENEEHPRSLQSGDVIQKMKDRPLPAPPRPPRKHKPILKDVTHEENIPEEEDKTKLEETEASVQTEPLPDDFICEEFIQEKNDKIITPSSAAKITTPPTPKSINEFEHQETITHGALVVAPVPASYQEGPLTSFSRSTERIITVKREVVPQEQTTGDEEASEVPDDFKKLGTEIQLLKTQKLQVSDLDVDRLTVNELLASKIKVSEIDGGSITVSEITPKSDNIVFGGVELPAGLLQELVQRLQALQSTDAPVEDAPPPAVTEEKSPSEDANLLQELEAQIITEEEMDVDEIPPLEKIESADFADEERKLIEDLKRASDEQKKTPFDDDLDLEDEPPLRPPRQSDYQRQRQDSSEVEGYRSETPPPPRPPQPDDILEAVFLRSQPPPSFYNLRSPVFHEIPDDIPLPPRRRRQQKTLSRSSSDEAPPRTRRHRTPEPSIPELAGQLTKACATAGEKALKRLIKYITNRVLQNADGRQDMHVMVVILLVLIAGLILLGWGDGKTVHYHHWEYFNPPRDM